MRVITAEEVDRALPYPALIEALRDAFRADIETPLRHTHMIAQPGGGQAKLLLMPAWTNSGRAPRRLQAGDGLSRQRQASEAVGLRQLSPALRRNRRATRRHGRHGP
jgi:hypothetical protein